MEMPKPAAGKFKMKKILYENYGLEDNHTDETFLSGLKKNVALEEVSLLEAISGSFLLMQELCTVIIFVLIYVYLYNEWSYPNTIMYTSVSITICGYIIDRLLYVSKSKLGHDVRTVLIFVVFGQLFSPALHTLTDTISTDTIYTMTFLMLLVHLTFFDYGVSAAIVSNSLSLSSAVFASICLASRLPSAHHAFVLITIAVKCFVLFPILRNKIDKPVVVSVLLASVVLYVLVTISVTVTFLFILVLIFICVICPVLFVRYQKYKENIYGPWDEAVVEDFVD